jgi:molecular chaperone DnaK
VLYEKSRAGQPAGETGSAAGGGTAGGSSEEDVVDAETVHDDKREAG